MEQKENLASFDEIQNDLEEEVTEITHPINNKLESVIPFGNKNYVKESMPKESDEMCQNIFTSQKAYANYYGKSYDFWIKNLQKDNDIELDIHIKLDESNARKSTRWLNESNARQSTGWLIESNAKQSTGWLDESNAKQSTGGLDESEVTRGIVKKKAKQAKGRPNYGTGKEHQKIENNPHYDQSYAECHVYKQLTNPNQKNINLLGKYFNSDFSQYFSKDKQEIRKFGRDEKRKVNIGYWFFEDLLSKENTREIVYPWINDKIQEINSLDK